MIERMGGGRSPEVPREMQELVKSPEQVFDRDPEQAREECGRALGKLYEIGVVRREGKSAEFSTIEMGSGNPPTIQIYWPEKRGAPATLLQLVPLSEGKGAESGVFGYTGSYGPGEMTKEGYAFVKGEEKSLEETFGAPQGVKFIIKPTPLAWAIENNAIDRQVFGENSRNLYMGLGLLLLGREYMFIGMHEAGHLPNNDENAAWSVASRHYAKLHGPRRDAIIKGDDTGEFDLLKRPDGKRDVTAGKIIRFGLSSYAITGKARVPERWCKGDALKRTMREFQDILLRAGEEYERMTR